jgi:hypothetical protein
VQIFNLFIEFFRMLSLKETIAILKARKNVAKNENNSTLQKEDQEVTKKRISPDRLESVSPATPIINHPSICTESQISDATGTLEQTLVCQPVIVEQTARGHNLSPVRMGQRHFEKVPVSSASVKQSPKQTHADTGIQSYNCHPVKQKHIVTAAKIPVSSVTAQKRPVKVPVTFVVIEEQKYPDTLDQTPTADSLRKDQIYSVTKLESEQISQLGQQQACPHPVEKVSPVTRSPYPVEQISSVTVEQVSSVTQEEQFIPEATPVILNSFSLHHSGNCEQERKEFDQPGI